MRHGDCESCNWSHPPGRATDCWLEAKPAPGHACAGHKLKSWMKERHVPQDADLCGGCMFALPRGRCVAGRPRSAEGACDRKCLRKVEAKLGADRRKPLERLRDTLRVRR